MLIPITPVLMEGDLSVVFDDTTTTIGRIDDVTLFRTGIFSKTNTDQSSQTIQRLLRFKYHVLKLCEIVEKW